MRECNLRCPRCKNHVLQKSEVKTKLRTKGPLVFEGEVCKTQCYWCGEPIEIPIQIISTEKEKFIIPKD